MTLKKFLISNWPILLILIIAAVLRFWRIEQLTTFGGEQGYDFEKIKEILQGNLSLLGPRIGPYNNISTLYVGPFYYYILAPFTALTRLDPLGASIAHVLARFLTSILIYFITKRLFGRTAAILALIISILSPYWVNYSGTLSGSYFILPLVALIIFLFLFYKKKTFVLWGFVGFLAGITFHFHYLALVILPAILIYLFNYQRFLKKGIFSFALGFIISVSPIILFELRHKFFLTNQLLRQFANNTSIISFNNFAPNLKIALSHISEDVIGLGSLYLFFFILLAFSVYLLFKKATKEQKRIDLFLIYLIVLNLIVASLYFGTLQPHYLAVAYVPIFIFAGAAIAQTKMINKYLPIVLIILISVFLFQKNNFFSTSGYTMPEDLTLKEIRKMSKIIVQDVGNETFNITSTLDGDSRAMPYRYLAEVYGKTPQDTEHYDRGDSLYVITRDPAAAVPQNPLFEIASFQPSNILRTWEIKGDIRLVKLSKKEKSSHRTEKFVTIVNPVRSRDLWLDKSVSNLKEQVEAVKNRDLLATWLLQYDTLSDDEIINLFKSQDEKQEIGAFLEVSEKWATDAKVSYKVSDGDYYRTDKVFLSGYTPQDRKKLIKTYFDKFHLVFGKYPKSAGAWYIDANSQKYLSKLGSKIVLTVADQYDTDATSIWGKYWGMPYYPSKFNSLEPAINQSNKIPVVNIQWAQRDPIAGYGKDIFASRNSFQANDYLNNGFDHTYFENLLSNYLNQKSDFVQITLGLEAGQEAVSFREEFDNQLDKIKEMHNLGQIEAVKMEDFAAWYQNKYPGISPSHFLQKDQSFWYMSPKFRVAIFKEGENFIIKDLRYYNNYPFRDYLYQDKNSHLEKKVPAPIDNLQYKNEINLGPAQNLEVFENFDRLTLKLDNRIVQINPKGVEIDQKSILKVSSQDPVPPKNFNYLLLIYAQIKNPITNALKIFRYSKIDGKRIFGIAVSDTKLIGFKGYVPQEFSFQFQSFSKFLSPADFINKFQPWIK